MLRLTILFLAITGVAHADRFEEYSGARTAEASDLVERACDLDLALHGAVVTGELRQRFSNTGPVPLAATLELAVPRGAVITGLATKDGVALAVPARSRTEKTTATDVLGIDPALLVMISPDHYRLTLQPIARDHDVTVTTRWSALAEIADGTLRVELPAHDAAGFGVCHGNLHVTPGPGTSVAALRIDGHELRARDASVFGIEARPLAIEVDLAFAAKRDPVVWTQTESLGDGWNATVATIVAPPARARPLGAHRALFVIDGSRSMELVGKANVVRVMRAIAGALPADTELDAIVYDRTAARVLGTWRTQTAETLNTLEEAIARHAAGNGSNLAGAFELAHQAIAGGVHGQTLVVVITDGVLGEIADTSLVNALAATTTTVDVHAIVIDPARTRSPNLAALQRPVSLYGGSLVELGVDELDRALVGADGRGTPDGSAAEGRRGSIDGRGTPDGSAAEGRRGLIDGWLRPAWLDVTLGHVAIPAQLRAGAGGSYAFLARGAPSLALNGKDLHVAARPAPAAPVAALVLALAPHADDSDPIRARAELAHPFASEQRAFAVLAAAGRVAADRRAMIKGGGPYTRLVAVDDPARDEPPAPPAQVGPSAIAAITLERLFRDQLQPKAYACYQRALGVSPNLVGTAHFDFVIGRGEVTSVSIVGLNNPAFDACLLDAAYQLNPPTPDFDRNADDETIAHYPLTFNTRNDRPFIVLGDADSSSPLDIDGIQGGLPERRKPIKVDATTPLNSGMRPSP